MRAAGLPPIITVEDPPAIASGAPAQVHWVNATAAGVPPIKTVGTPGGRIRPPTCGFTPSGKCGSPTRAVKRGAPAGGDAAVNEASAVFLAISSGDFSLAILTATRLPNPWSQWKSLIHPFHPPTFYPLKKTSRTALHRKIRTYSLDHLKFSLPCNPAFR